MATSEDKETARDILVALINRVEGLSWGDVAEQDKAEKIGKGIVTIYQLLLEAVEKR